MKKLILLTLFAAALSFGQQPGTAPASKAKVLTRVELDKLLTTPDRVLLIDVRRPDEIASIGGFPVYLSIQAADIDKHLSEIPKDKLIVLVSNHAGKPDALRICWRAKRSRSLVLSAHKPTNLKVASC
jgi:hypothetical protein